MYLKNSNITEIVTAVSQMEASKDSLLLIMLAEKNIPNIPELIAALNARQINFMGGIFPGVIHGEKCFKEGAILKMLPALGKPHLVRGLDTDAFILPDFTATAASVDERQSTAIVFVDGLTKNIAGFLSELYARLGHSVNYIGGGTGSLSLKREPYLFTAEGFFKDTAIVGFIHLQSRLGVRHGWHKIAGPFVATKTRHNIIEELNWRNALNVYRETVEKDMGMPLDVDQLLEVTRAYPFGIYKEGAENVVRDPVAVTEDGGLVCVGEVPENVVLDLLRGNRDSLMQAAREVAQYPPTLAQQSVQYGLVIDCVSRTLFLEQAFTQELAAIQTGMSTVAPHITPEGALTLGEIASYGEEYLEFYNKTIVTGMFYEGKL